ncbi:hypothetical protein GCM10010381_25740 [Streptomyces xantholiticus]|nr:hypothetical protein GCM10010381_25740 [Streptomyces xantholiticus]
MAGEPLELRPQGLGDVLELEKGGVQEGLLLVLRQSARGSQLPDAADEVLKVVAELIALRHGSKLSDPPLPNCPGQGFVPKPDGQPHGGKGGTHTC